MNFSGPVKTKTTDHIVDDIIRTLEEAPRIGAAQDKPEGTRYIQISDTLATSLAERLNRWWRG